MRLNIRSPASQVPGWGLFLRSGSVMTPADSLSLILRRLDEIERKLDYILE